MKRYVYNFGNGKADGNASMKDILGGKGANLAEMTNINLPVPPGFTISTEVCEYYYKNNKQLPKSIKTAINESIKVLENNTNCLFGDHNKPLLVSVRSGSRASMPGMMDTILNLGLNDSTIIGLAKSTNNERFAYDSYRRFIQMYADVVLEVDSSLFEDALENLKHENNIELDTELNTNHLKQLVDIFKKIIKKEINLDFPQNPNDQLWKAIAAVFDSWGNTRAVTYRKLNNIPSEWGTAVNIQSMVFGNMGDDSGTGVAFTRDPSSGKNIFYGEYLLNAQGEDVVAGIRTPLPLTLLNSQNQKNQSSLEEVMPKIFAQLNKMRVKLEKHYKDMQDIEFTIQQGKLYLLQTRNGKRTAEAGVRIAVELVKEKIINKQEALLRVPPESLNQLLHPTLDPSANFELLISGLPASPGAVSGKIVLNSEEAEKMALSGERVILVRLETSPEDISGMHAAAGILTARGGMTSHAAVVARGMGRACITGANELRIDESDRKIFFGKKELDSGTEITIDGSSGDVYLGIVPTIYPEMSSEYDKLMNWSDQYRRMKVRTNAETASDVKTAKEFGAEGIGLCRTEHMFFDEKRISVMRQMILADSKEERTLALNKLLPMQRLDFESIFLLMEGQPVTIRLLDPPLHEFLPSSQHEIDLVCKEMGVKKEVLRQRLIQLEEANPMLGHRGCRLAITYPEICEMQATAILEAAANVQKKISNSIQIEIMVPLVSSKKEIVFCKNIIDEVANKISKKLNCNFNYLVGTMIEIPRAALLSSQLAEVADFFSFGTNDLTQTVFGISRDDSGTFLNEYIEGGFYINDPFVSIDENSVGELVSISAKNGKLSNKEIKLGICGEHGGDPKSIRFFEKISLDYVSASPFRVPIARLSAAQASILNKSA